MRRREVITLLGGAAAAWPLAARAQQPAMPLIGFLSSLSQNDLGLVIPGFLQGLNSAGFIEGRSIAIEYRWAEGDYQRLPALAGDLVNRKVTSTVGQIDDAFATCKQQQVRALITSSDPFFFSERVKLVVLMARDALPTIFAE